ncbi:hypothetical protein KC340_g13437 [Hortaea werneckii]|nr:hypothetical protein KC342_g17051 [Hortaea werneckii]KAI7057047.1 hypothetical protein KC339_g18022 [Hortaea werneckii]KAI7219027.1 hypothetical protein KC365_g12440 [Hortaea werneckii]KAI7300234.1 hypothetical protein KC340_g13437 [Hortaea werneckii]KAI7401676.1 hypothetical protein KC328_g3092 [Hortaea werneckii]
MSAVQVPSSSALRGGLALQPLEVATCPIREMAGVVNAEGFFNYVDDTTRDVFFLQLQHSRLYMVGWMTTVGLAPVVERHVFARWAAHDVSGKHGRNRDIDFFVGPSIVREEEASLPSSWYRCPHDDLPYTDFRGVPGTNLWLKVNDLGLIDFHPMYEREYDGLHEIWLNIYQSMIGLVAPVVLDRVPSFGGWREEHESNAESTDEDEPVRVSRV